MTFFLKYLLPYFFFVHNLIDYRSKSDEYDTTSLLVDDGDDDDDDDGDDDIAFATTTSFLHNEDGVIKRNATELICKDTFWYKDRTFAHCYDDRDCKLYGDCCANSREFYVEKEQTVPSVDGIYDNGRYGCYRVNGTNTVARMIGKCPRTNAGQATSSEREVREKCERGGDFVSVYPVTSADTKHTYKNAYCAWCHGERRNVVYWKPVFHCYGPGGKATKRVRLEDAYDQTLIYRHGAWYYADYERLTLLPCDFQLQLPNDSVSTLRPCLWDRTGLIDGCPTDAPAPWARACASHAYVLFEDRLTGDGKVETRAFRNADCAKCNNVTVDRLRCVPPPPPLRAAFAFGSLFSGGRRESCAPDELYDVQAAECRNVIRDELDPVGCRAFGPGEYDVRSLDDETAYVYAYKKRVRYRMSDAVGVEVCVENAGGRLPPYSPPAYLVYSGIAGSSASAAALVAHLVLFCTAPGPKNLPEKNLASLAVGLLLGYCSYLAIALRAVRPGPGLPCLAAALSMQFGFLSAFAWMFVMSADVWTVLHASTKKFRVAGGKRTGRFAAYSAFAWLAPAALTAFAAWSQITGSPADLRPGFQHDCWFRNPRSLVALFVLPAGTTIVANYVSFFGAVRLIATSGDGVASSGACSAAAVDRSRKNLKIYARLSLMMGLAWAFGLAGAITDSDLVWAPYTVLNSLQGAFMFLAFDCNCNAVKSLVAFSGKLSSSSDAQVNTAVTPLSASN